jgi:hypothetical protein
VAFAEKATLIIHPRPRSDLPKRAHAIEHHIEQVLGMIHARSIALSDLSEVGKPQGRQLNPTEQMIAAVGEDAHQIALAVEALLEALRYQGLSSNGTETYIRRGFRHRRCP